jgi:hypothetical protein
LLLRVREKKEVEIAAATSTSARKLSLTNALSILAMRFVLMLVHFVLVMVAPEPMMMMAVRMILTVLLRENAAVMARVGIARVGAGPAVVVGTAVVVVAGARHSRGQRREHNSEYQYFQFKTSNVRDEKGKPPTVVIGRARFFY